MSPEETNAFLAAIVESSQDAIFSKNLKGIILSWNMGAQHMYGYTEKEAVGKHVSILTPESLKDEMELILKKIKNGERVEIIDTIRKTKDGRLIDVSLVISPIIDSNGKIAGASTIARNTTELRKSQKKFRDLLESAPDATVIINPKGKIKLVNAQLENLFGYKRTELEEQTLEILIPDRFKSAHIGHRTSYFSAPAARPMGVGLALWGKKKDGTEFPAEISLSPLETEEGTWAMAAVRDVTQRQIAEEKIKESLLEKEVLLKEIHHRVKNNLQIISSLLNLEARRVKEKNMVDILQQSQDRVKSMALIHEKLYATQNLSKVNFSDYIVNLTTELAQSYRVDPKLVQFNLKTEPIELVIDVAVPIGLIINELISNSLKHGFPEGRKGQIEILLTKKDQQLILQISDNGIGLPKNLNLSKTDTLGFQIVNALCRQIEGELTVNSERGTLIQIRLSI